MDEYFIAWWNLENLFGPQNDPRRTPRLQKILQRELAGWNEEVLSKKVAQLASVIRRMNDGQGPDLLGVCEVENRQVLDQLIAAIPLPQRNYTTIHHDTADERGIDIAFIYDANRFSTKPDELFHHVILKRNATRDLVQATFYTKPAGNPLVCIGNHWPSKLGGVYESEPYRMLAGETLAYWLSRIHEVFAERDTASGKLSTSEAAIPPAVLVMGDFNDEPPHRSLTDYALALRTETRVRSRRSKNPYLWNLMWPLMGSGHMTHMYDGEPTVIDQFLVNRGLIDRDSPLTLRRIEVNGKRIPFVGIIRFPEMVNTTGKNRSGPRRFSRPEEPDYDESGYSDHFPIALRIVEREASPPNSKEQPIEKS